MKRFAVEVLETQPTDSAAPADIAQRLEAALNAPAHEEHRLEGVYAIKDWLTVVVWRTNI
jgi:hypothetical protein